MKMSKTFWNIWTSYAMFYFGRVNLSMVIPVILATYGDLSLYNVGFVASGFMLTYALGQFLHGQLSERFNPFVYMAIGLLGSAAMNCFLGFSAGFFWMLLIGEMLDGGFQSMGWSSAVRANAYTSSDIEKSATVLGTAYQVGNALAWIVCAFVIGQFGWQWGFWAATIVMAIRGVVLLGTMPKFEFKPRMLKERVKLTLSFPIIVAALSLCLLNMIRYGVITWIPTYLFREFSMPIEKVGFNIFLIPIFGVLGTLLYNKIKLPRDLSTIIYLSILGVVLVFLPETQGTPMLLLLLASGFFLYGPHVFLVTTLPSRFHAQNIVAAATGFIDGWGYVGSIAIGIVVPFMLTSLGMEWAAVFYFWAIIAFVAVALVSVAYLKSKGVKQIGT